MPLLNELETQNYLRIFVMGEPGTGKTVGSTTFPGPIKIYDFDGKVDSAYNYWKAVSPERLSQIDYEDCKPRDQKGSGFKICNESLGKILQEYKLTKKIPYNTIIIDSTTMMAPEMLNWLVHFETGIKRNKEIKSMQVASMQDYMIFAPTLSNFIYELFSLPCHIILTGHIAIDKDELTGEITRSASIPGQMAKKIPVIFPEVYVSLVKNDKYMVQTKADYKYPCRSQIHGIPKEVPFTYADLIKKY